MKQLSDLRVLFLGGRQAGVIGLLTAIATSCEVKGVVIASSKNDKSTGVDLETIARSFNLNIYHSVKQVEVRKLLRKIDALISIHSREIIPKDILNSVQWAINVHPCLYKYKGADPIQRFLADGETKASVGVHRMTEDVDMGETICELFVDIDRTKVNSVVEVYNILYPYYSLALIEALEIIEEMRQ